jgi:hypothetical protein
MTETDLRNELALIVSRFGAEVCPAEVPEQIVANYLHGLSTGEWYLKTPRPRDERLVLHAIAGINCAIEAQSQEQLEEAGRVLLGAVMQALGTSEPSTDRDTITCERRADNSLGVILLKHRYGQKPRPMLIGEFQLDAV